MLKPTRPVSAVFVECTVTVRIIVRSIGGLIPKQNQAEMVFGKEILQSVVLVAIGGIVALLASKLFEGNEGTTAQREIRGEDELNEAKQPQEHDERFC